MKVGGSCESVGFLCNPMIVLPSSLCVVLVVAGATRLSFVLIR